MGGKGKIFITGEVTSKASVNVDNIVKRVLASVGYDTNYEIINNLGKQSPDIAMGTNDEVGGAGDQGMMFGYAVNDTKELLPTAMVILQRFSKWYDKERQTCSYLKSDGKEHRDYTDNLIKEACLSICKDYDIEIEEFLINPTGKFEIGGFEGDAGLTGRKIVVDSYQSFCKVGGGSFSGKDPTKVDRSAAYKARLIAKDSDKGYIEPDESLYIECTPKNIIKDLNLLNICYEEKARFGHFQD